MKIQLERDVLSFAELMLFVPSTLSPPGAA